MTNWKIDVAGVEGVLGKVQTSVDALGKDLSAKSFGDLNSAVTGGYTPGGPAINGLLMLVPQAVNNLMGDQKKNFDSIGNHIRAGIIGVTAAKIYYHNGQTDMCSAVQSHMSASAASGDFSWFENEGIIKK